MLLFPSDSLNIPALFEDIPPTYLTVTHAVDYFCNVLEARKPSNVKETIDDVAKRHKTAALRVSPSDLSLNILLDLTIGYKGDQC